MLLLSQENELNYKLNNEQLSERQSETLLGPNIIRTMPFHPTYTQQAVDHNSSCDLARYRLRLQPQANSFSLLYIFV